MSPRIVRPYIFSTLSADDNDVHDGDTYVAIIVQMFEWDWDSVAQECTDFLGPAGEYLSACSFDSSSDFVALFLVVVGIGVVCWSRFGAIMGLLKRRWKDESVFGAGFGVSLEHRNGGWEARSTAKMKRGVLNSSFASAARAVCGGGPSRIAFSTTNPLQSVLKFHLPLYLPLQIPKHDD